MKYRLGSVTIEAIDTYVRVTVANFGGIGNKDKIKVTKRERPSSIDVAELLAELRGLRVGELDSAMLQMCGRAAEDAKNNQLQWEI